MIQRFDPLSAANFFESGYNGDLPISIISSNIGAKMSPLIYELLLPKTLSDGFAVQDGIEGELRNLSSLNVFIGVNNAGKSRFLRGLFASRQVKFRPPHDMALIIQNAQLIMQKATNDIRANFSGINTDSFRWFNDIRNYSGTDTIVEPTHPVLRDIKTLETIAAEISNPESHRGSSLRSQLEGHTVPTALRAKAQIDKMMATLPTTCEFKRVYVPSLRGLRCPREEKAFYLHRTAKDYFQHIGPYQGGFYTGNSVIPVKDTDISTGVELFEQVRSYLLGDLEQRETIKDYERFLSANFFEGRDVTLIPREADDVLHVKIGYEKEQPIYNLGDGIQQIIIMTMPVFLHRKANLLLFIEEPETALHPGLQRALIDCLLREPDSPGSRQVFISTHSHQFLDITLDSSKVSVYKFSKQMGGTEDRSHLAKFKVTPTSDKDFELLRELGVRNSSLMLSNCTIWVEGITDRMYIRRFIEIYEREGQLQFREDTHYSFVEYGGDTITHWSFLDSGDKAINVERLCGKLFLVSDHDSGKEERQARLREALKDRYYCLDGREIENLLTPEVIASVVKSYEGDEVLLKQFGQADYKNELLGNFIESRVIPAGVKSKRRAKNDHPYADESGTVRGKLAFAERAPLQMKGKNDLSTEAWDLATKIHDFIRKAQ